MDFGAEDARFPREERLKKRADIGRVFRKGKKVGCEGAKLFVSENGLGRNRIAFTFSRKFGMAVTRNRARRLGREAYRHLRGSLRQGYDMVLLVYPQGIDYAGRLGQLSTLLSRVGLRSFRGGS